MEITRYISRHMQIPFTPHPTRTLLENRNPFEDIFLIDTKNLPYRRLNPGQPLGRPVVGIEMQGTAGPSDILLDPPAALRPIHP
jgi:hypothetical protein